MAQILSVGANCAKRKVERGIRQTEAEDHAIQPVDDIIGVFEDNHQFSPTEQDVFNIIQVEGMTKAEVEAVLEVQKRGERAQFRNGLPFADSTEEWFDDADGKWKRLTKKPKFRRSMANASQGDKGKLGRSNVSRAQKETILRGSKNRIKDYPENSFEITIQ